MPFNVPEPSEVHSVRSVTVLWSPGVGRDLAHRLIEGEGRSILGLDAGDVRVANHCAVCGSSEHGRPVLTSHQTRVLPRVSISYAADLTVVALTWAGPVGVDVERIDATESFDDFDAVVAHPHERATDVRARAATWVRKESLLKATGKGLSIDPREIRLTEPGQQPDLTTWGAAGGPGGPVWMYDVELTPEHAAAVTVLAAAERPPIAVKRADLAAQRR